MKTTVEIPDALLLRAKSKAAETGVPLVRFVTEALSEKLKKGPATAKKAWMRHVGKLKHLHKETQRINELIEEAFEVEK